MSSRLISADLKRPYTGFTLIELLLVIIILAIVGAGTFGFITTGTKIYIDGVEREQLVADSRFVIERLSREVRNALPNSQRLLKQGNERHCLEFVPILAATMSVRVPIAGAGMPTHPDAQQEVEAIEIGNQRYQPPSMSPVAQYLAINTTKTSHVYDNNTDRLVGLVGVTDSKASYDDGAEAVLNNDGIVRLQLARVNGFPQNSPTERAYIVSTPVSYCVHQSGNITRHSNYGFFPQQSTDLTNDGIGGGALMARYNSNVLSDTTGAVIGDPFRLAQSVLIRNNQINLFLTFNRGEEIITYNHEVVITNVP